MLFNKVQIKGTECYPPISLIRLEKHQVEMIPINTIEGNQSLLQIFVRSKPEELDTLTWTPAVWVEGLIAKLLLVKQFIFLIEKNEPAMLNKNQVLVFFPLLS